MQTHTHTLTHKNNQTQNHSQCDSSGTASSSPVACIQKDATKSTLKQDDENYSAERVHDQATPESLSSQSDIVVTSNAKTYRYRTKAKSDHAKYESLYFCLFCVPN